jgi:hypothetical protein
MAIPGFRSSSGRVPSGRYTALGSISCGAELSEANPKTLAMWRDLVDSIQGAA